MGDLFDTIGMIFERSGFKAFLADGGWKTLIMYVIVGVLVYLAIVKKSSRCCCCRLRLACC